MSSSYIEITCLVEDVVLRDLSLSLGRGDKSVISDVEARNSRDLELAFKMKKVKLLNLNPSLQESERPGSVSGRPSSNINSGKNKVAANKEVRYLVSEQVVDLKKGNLLVSRKKEENTTSNKTSSALFKEISDMVVKENMSVKDKIDMMETFFKTLNGKLDTTLEYLSLIKDSFSIEIAKEINIAVSKFLSPIEATLISLSNTIDSEKVRLIDKDFLLEKVREILFLCLKDVQNVDYDIIKEIVECTVEKKNKEIYALTKESILSDISILRSDPLQSLKDNLSHEPDLKNTVIDPPITFEDSEEEDIPKLIPDIKKMNLRGVKSKINMSSELLKK